MADGLLERSEVVGGQCKGYSSSSGKVKVVTVKATVAVFTVTNL